MKPGRIALLVCGALVAITALGLLAGGIGTLALRAARTDGDGFLRSPSYALSSAGYAVTTPTIDLQAAPGEWAPWVGTPQTQLAVTGPESKELFVGVGPTADVQAHLEGVAHDELTDISEPGRQVELKTVGGGSTPAPPGEQTFWVEQQEGSGTQR